LENSKILLGILKSRILPQLYQEKFVLDFGSESKSGKYFYEINQW